MYRIGAGLGIATAIGGSVYWYQRFPHNQTAKKLANEAITEAKPHLNWTLSEAKESERLYGKGIEKVMSGEELAGTGYTVDLTRHVWSAVMPNGKPGSYRVITGVDNECVEMKEVHINS